MSNRTCLIFFILFLVLAACIESYTPQVSSQGNQHLIVDGFLNSEQGIATVELTYTLPLYSTDTPMRETEAIVSIDSEDHQTMVLPETSNGVYKKSGLAIDLSKRYRLHILTKRNKEYYSEFIAIKKSPPIDSVFWQVSSQGLNIYVNSHDDTGNTRFYRWSVEETWEYYAYHSSSIKYEKFQVVPRADSERINRCWTEDPIESILLKTSRNSHKDIISHFQVAHIPKGSRKLSKLYSINVKQQALTEAAYDYWYSLRQTTETVGGLFDSMPYQIKGNITNATNPSDPVFGFFSGGTIEEQRIFISTKQIPDAMVYNPNQEVCPIDTIRNPGQPGILLIDVVYPGGYIIGSYDRCIDCRLAGGTTTKPIYWQ